MNITMAALGDVVEIKGGGTPSKANPSFWNGNIPWISPKDMKRWEIDDAEDKVTADAIENSTTNLIPPNSVLVVNRSGILKHTLPVGITRRPVAINQDLKALICNGRSDPEYIAHIVKAAEPIVLKWVRATTADNFSIDNLRSLEIPLPPLDEQRRIAAILNKADALRRKRKRAIELLDSLAQSIFLEMFGSLTANERKWRTSNIGDACELIVDCVNRTAPVVDQATPYKMIRTTNVRNGCVDLANVRHVTEETFHRWNRRAVPRAGDVLLTREAPVGGIGILRGNEKVFLGQRLMLYRPRMDRMTSEFLASSFHDKFLREQFDRMSSGSTVKHLPLPACRAFQLRLPPISLQQEFSSRLSIVARMSDGTIAMGDQLINLFSSLQSRAFSGQL